MTWHPAMPEAYQDRIVLGDARLLAPHIPDQSIDLIFTDPVYERLEDYAWLGALAARVLRPSGHLLAWQHVGRLPETQAMLGAFLVYRWTLAMYHPNISKLAITPELFSHWRSCLWYTLTRGVKVVKRFRDVQDVPFVANPRHIKHRWSKDPKAIRMWLPCFVPPGGVVWDPFTGSGVVPQECKRAGYHFLASELDPATAAQAQVDLELTQAMHPLLLEEQQGMALE
jgi:DNA modification methylase